MKCSRQIASPHYSRFLRKWRSGTNLPAAADGSVVPKHPSPIPWVLIPAVRAWQHLYGSTSATSTRFAHSRRTFMGEGKQAFMKIRGKTMTLCRSRGESGGARHRELGSRLQVRAPRILSLEGSVTKAGKILRFVQALNFELNLRPGSGGLRRELSRTARLSIARTHE